MKLTFYIDKHNVYETDTTLVNQKALMVAATLPSRLFNALEWAKIAKRVIKDIPVVVITCC